MYALYYCACCHNNAQEVPLNNAPFLVSEFVRIGNLPSETDRLTAIATLVNWESVKPGDFYDDLGVHGKQPHLMPGPGFDTDPGFLRSAMDVTMRMNTQSAEPLGPPPTFPLLPRQWSTLSKTLYATPMLVSYDGLPAGAGVWVSASTWYIHAFLRCVSHDIGAQCVCV